MCRQKYLFGNLFLQCRRSRHHVFLRIWFLYGDWLATLYTAVNAHRLNWRRNLHLWRIGHCFRHERYYVIVCPTFLPTQPHLTTSLTRHHLRHLGLSGEEIKTQHKLSKYSRWRWGCCLGCLGLHNCRNLQFICPILHISLTELVGCVPPSQLHQFVKPHLLLPKALCAVLYRFADGVHPPARFIIFAQLAKLCIFFIIILVFPILFIFGTCKITQT